MFVYEKKLQDPVRIKNTNPKLASIIISQYGGPNGELGAALRYLSQRYSMPFDEQRGQQAQGEQQAETTFFHGDLPFFLVMLKMREAMIFHIFMVF